MLGLVLVPPIIPLQTSKLRLGLLPFNASLTDAAFAHQSKKISDLEHAHYSANDNSQTILELRTYVFTILFILVVWPILH